MEKFNGKFDFSVKDLFFFDKFVVPSVLTLVYWVALVLVVLSGLVMMFASFFGGLITILVGFVSTRITFELICVIFSINRNLQKLVELQSGSANVATTPEDVSEKTDANIHIAHDKEEN